MANITKNIDSFVHSHLAAIEVQGDPIARDPRALAAMTIGINVGRPNTLEHPLGLARNVISSGNQKTPAKKGSFGLVRTGRLWVVANQSGVRYDVRMTSRKELKPEDVVAIIDTREQLPYDLKPLKTVVATLSTGDYSLIGHEKMVSIERKSLEDFLGCIGQSRERFERECTRLLDYPTRAIVVEASWADLERGEWRSKITPNAAMGSALGWIAMGIPIIFGGNRASCQKLVARLLFIAARRAHRAELESA